MAQSLRSAFRKVWLTLSSIKTGVILIILVVIFSAAGTVILQRPITDPEDIQRAYSPAMLRFLDAVGLTDVFHARWFVTLMILVSLSIIAASVQRFPNAWRFFSRPYKSPDENFRRVLATQAHIPISNEEEGLAAAERVYRNHRRHHCGDGGRAAARPWYGDGWGRVGDLRWRHDTIPGLPATPAADAIHLREMGRSRGCSDAASDAARR